MKPCPDPSLHPLQTVLIWHHILYVLWRYTENYPCHPVLPWQCQQNTQEEDRGRLIRLGMLAMHVYLTSVFHTSPKASYLYSGKCN